MSATMVPDASTAVVVGSDAAAAGTMDGQGRHPTSDSGSAPDAAPGSSASGGGRHID